MGQKSEPATQAIVLVRVLFEVNSARIFAGASVGRSWRGHRRDRRRVSIDAVRNRGPVGPPRAREFSSRRGSRPRIGRRDAGHADRLGREEGTSGDRGSASRGCVGHRRRLTCRGDCMTLSGCSFHFWNERIPTQAPKRGARRSRAGHAACDSKRAASGQEANNEQRDGHREYDSSGSKWAPFDRDFYLERFITAAGRRSLLESLFEVSSNASTHSKE